MTAALALPLLTLVGTTSPAAAVTLTGATGPVRFAVAKETGQSATCTISNGAVAKLTVRSPEAKMRGYWTKPHGGQVAQAQYVRFTATLQGRRSGHWTVLAKQQNNTLVAKSWKRLKTLPGFTARTLKSGYSAYRVTEKATWLEPRSNYPEGDASVAVTHYRRGSTWKADCRPYVVPVSALTAVIQNVDPRSGKGQTVLSWKVPGYSGSELKLCRSIDGTPPPRPTCDAIVTLPGTTTTYSEPYNNTTLPCFSIFVHKGSRYSRPVGACVKV